MRVVGCAVVLTLGVAACGGGGHDSADRIDVGTTVRAATSTTASQTVQLLPGGASATTIGSLDPSYDVPQSTNMAGNPNGTGVFIWSESRTDVQVTRVDDHGMTHWNAANGRGGGASVGQSIAVDAHGIVWVVAGNHLIRLDPESDTISAVLIPAPAQGSVGQVVGPPEIRTSHSLQAIAVDKVGDVAIAMENSSQVLVHHERSGLFSRVDLPANFAAWSVGYFGDGTLAVGGLVSYSVSTVLLFAPSGTVPRSIAIPDAARLTAISDTALLAGKFSSPFILTADGTLSPVRLPANRVVVAGPLPNGDLLSAGQNDLVDMLPDGSVANTYRFPEVACGRLGLGGMMQRTTEGSSCAVAPDGMQTDGTGNVWLVQHPLPTEKPGASPSETVTLVKGF